MDRISPLPDEIIGHILSFLPTKQAASTSVLSKRWRNVFVLVTSLDLEFSTVNFDYRRKPPRSISDYRKTFIDFVDNLLSLQGKSPIKKLTLNLDDFSRHLPRVLRWIRNVLERGSIVDLNLGSIVDSYPFYKERNQLLSSLIFKNNTLVTLRLGGGFMLKLSQDVYLPKLRILCLDSVDFGVHHDVFGTLLPRCPVLEELVVENRYLVNWYGSVSSRSLKKLIIRFFCIPIPVIHLDVPNLVYLELSCFVGCKYANVNMDSLVEARLNLSVQGNQLQELRLRRGSADLVPADMINIIIRIRNIRVLHLTSKALEMYYISGQELPKFDNLVCLCISSYAKHGWQILPLLIKNSPNLETLIFKGLEHYKTTNCGDVCVCSGSKENSSSCLSSCRVKVLEIWGYKGSSEELTQMKHFLRKLPYLEIVKIKAVNNLRVPISIQVQNLLTLRRASSNRKIQILTE